MSETEYQAWVPPDISGEQQPSLIGHYLPLPATQNFARTAKWSPDGTQVLLQGEDHSLQLISCPSEPVPSESNLEICRSFRQPSPLVDYTWFPYASVNNPATYCFVTSVRDCPVKLHDAQSGKLRASYPIVDHRERQIAPHCVTFNPYGTKLYCGFEDAIEVFDVRSPGEGVRLHTTPSKKTKDGLKGLISSLAFSLSDQGTVFAAGTLNASQGNIALFDERQGENPLMFIEGGLIRGVTQLRFNPREPHILYASYRRQNAIFSWDLRSTPLEPCRTFHSTHSCVPTNQKTLFDVDPGGKWLCQGRNNGLIDIFDLAAPSVQEDEQIVTANPALTFTAHSDSIGGVAFSPTTSRLCSVSGSRHFEPSEVGTSSDSESEEDSTKQTLVKYPKGRPKPTLRDSSVKLWQFMVPSGTTVSRSTS